METWQLEREVCERVARQYRCVGDALAWRVFDFQRKQIIALCQNAPPGVMAGKKGLAAELDLVEQARAAGQFAILHDLTNCLRIGDVTVFGNDGSFETIEVKTDLGGWPMAWHGACHWWPPGHYAAELRSSCGRCVASHELL